MVEVIKWILTELYVLGLLEPDTTLEFKLGLDGRPFWGRGQVMIGLTCISEAKHYGFQRPDRVFPLVILNGEEEYKLLEQILKSITDDMYMLINEGIKLFNNDYGVHFKGFYLFLKI